MFTDNRRPRIFTNYDLPFDILELIFSFLSLEDNVGCLLVSKHWFHFIMDLHHFSKLCSNGLPSLANNKDAMMQLLQQILSSGSRFVIQGSSSSVTTEVEQNSTVTTNNINTVTHADTEKLLTYTLKNNTQINSLCFKDCVQGMYYESSSLNPKELLAHRSISTYSLEYTTMESCAEWDQWTVPHQYHGTKLKSITINGNGKTRQHFKEAGWYLITEPVPTTIPIYGTTAPYREFRATMSPDLLEDLEYFKFSLPTPSRGPPRYPDCGAFGRLPSLVHLYLDALNHINPLLCARVASDHSPKLRNIIISPLAEMPEDVRCDYSIDEIAQIASPSSSSSYNIEDDDDYNHDGLRCFVWTMGNTRPEDPENFEWLCSVNTCPCYKKNVARIMAKHYQHLKLLYLQFDGQHGIAFRSIRFLSNIEDYARNLRELHLHATSSTLFGQFQCSDTEKRHYGSADNISHYLAQAIVHLPALEVIVLENEDCSSLILPQEEVSSIVYMTIYDDVLRSLAINCSRLKEVVIWGPHIQITASGVIEFVLKTVSNQSLETIEIDCSLTDHEVGILLHRKSLMTKLKSLKVKDRSNLLYSFQQR